MNFMRKKYARGLLGAVLATAILAGCGAGSSSMVSSALSTAASSAAASSATQAEGLAMATTEEVAAAVKDGSAIVVDARLNDAYNGWALEGISRGGHIPGATDFPALGLESQEEDAEIILQRSTENKGLLSGKKLIIYDAGGGEAQKVADYLAEKGAADIALYDVNTWADDTALEMEAYPNYQLVVPALVVNALLQGETVDTFEENRPIKVVDVSWGSNEESGYLEGHVPTAFHINTDNFEPPTETDPPEWRLGSDEELLALALENGITAGDCVITTSAQPMAAYRFATILQYLGVEDVRVMNGGMNEWKAAGYELSTENVTPEPAEDFGVPTPAQPDVVDTVAETQELLGQDGYSLMDVRTWKEYIGEDTGYSYHNIAGRIDGALYAYSGEDGDSNSMTHYRNADWTMRNGYEILQMWEDAGADMQGNLAFMCGGGWRAAETYWFARVMGLEASLFSDGWCAWSNDGLPFVTGEPGAEATDNTAASGSAASTMAG